MRGDRLTIVLPVRLTWSGVSGWPLTTGRATGQGALRRRDAPHRAAWERGGQDVASDVHVPSIMPSSRPSVSPTSLAMAANASKTVRPRARVRRGPGARAQSYPAVRSRLPRNLEAAMLHPRGGAYATRCMNGALEFKPLSPPARHL